MMKKPSSLWNPWHGCHKLSEGCRHCYVYRIDGKHGKDSSVVAKTDNYDLPLRRKKNGEYKIPAGNTVFTCFSSDFLVEDADGWRKDAWKMRIFVGMSISFLLLSDRPFDGMVCLITGVTVMIR